MTYLGARGYQPLINYWAEQDLIWVDEFRDGNVPAGMDCLSSFLRAVRACGDDLLSFGQRGLPAQAVRLNEGGHRASRQEGGGFI